MTHDEYVEAGGKCPKCGSEKIMWCGPADCHELRKLTIETQCRECETSWFEVYRLVGYGELLGE